ncbi:MAG: hypothetical protein JEY91_14160 [Spirochaetaceae bacterium]|nr:hypothetical protein [Spirochaetaceae bacterium]
MKLFPKRKQKLKKPEIDAVIDKIRGEYDKYIVTFHKPATLKQAFENRYRTALIEGMDIERFLNEEIAAVQSIFIHQKKIDKEKKTEQEKERQKALRKNQPDFADQVLKKLKDKIIVYPALKFHKDASYEITHLYGAIWKFEKQHWPSIDNFISENQSWALRGEKKDFNNEIWRFIPSGENGIPVVLERYYFMLNRSDTPLKEISYEAQQCIKQAAFLLNDILWSCNQIIKTGIDSNIIEKNLIYVQNIVEDFRIKDLKNR